MKINKKLIKELTDYLNEYNLTELEYGDGNTKIKVSKNNNLSSLPANNIPKKSENTVMIVEAMKTMNHVPSPSDGVVKNVQVEDGQPVEYGQTLVILE